MSGHTTKQIAPKSNGTEAELIYNGKSSKFPIYKAVSGCDVMDISTLNKEFGLFTYDPGFMSTASCQSGITYIDGDAGILRHRGYAIEELAAKSSFTELSYLLLNGELPSHAEHEHFCRQIKSHTMVHEQLQFLFRGYPRRAHPMSIMVGTSSSLSAFYHESIDIQDETDRTEVAHKIIAKIPTLAAMTYKYLIGQPFVYPKNALNFSENFLHMMFAVPSEEYHVNPVLARAIDKIFILHADHEQNASTSTVRLSGSSGANPFACVASGIASLWGPSHGGANEAVIRMLREIKTPDRIPEFIKRAKDRNDSFRLMGFGHRIYKNYDPRAAVLKQTCDDVFKALGICNDPLLDIALKLEEIALHDDYFIEKKLFPNVDFYSGIIYKAMGIPLEMFTVLFAVARASGWIAQWKEMMEDEEFRIGRPRQLYSGQDLRSYVEIDKR